jgi:N-acetylmuramic acid 6-phosphate (MurNAc-6-P) etherase
VNLAGYKIHYGSSADALDQVVTIASSGVTTYVIQNLTSGYWYFSLRAYTNGSVESDLSAVVGTKI